uniref:Uncharacterized protein n=1 Tax=Gopherus evgoodei TaxID=1825980 RepID=A0A8C4VSJ5_9SAUR
ETSCVEKMPHFCALLEKPRPEQGPKVPLPEYFDGSCQQFCSFINQCRDLFLTCPQTYNSDLSSVSLPISLLVLFNRNAFLQSMSVILDDLHQA